MNRKYLVKKIISQTLSYSLLINLLSLGLLLFSLFLLSGLFRSNVKNNSIFFVYGLLGGIMTFLINYFWIKKYLISKTQYGKNILILYFSFVIIIPSIANEINKRNKPIEICSMTFSVIESGIDKTRGGNYCWIKISFDNSKQKIYCSQSYWYSVKENSIVKVNIITGILFIKYYTITDDPSFSVGCK